MKMLVGKHDLLAAILAAANKASGANPPGCNGVPFSMRQIYNGGAFTKTVIDATMCAIIAQFIRDLLDFAD